jgi:hypothetical protein
MHQIQGWQFFGPLERQTVEDFFFLFANIYFDINKRHLLFQRKKMGKKLNAMYFLSVRCGIKQ